MNRLLLVLLLGLSTPAAAETLGEAIGRAVAGNPTLAAARARQDARAEAPAQARAAALPSAAVEGAVDYDRESDGRTADVAVTAAMPIWTGGRVESALRVAKAEVKAGEEELRDAQAGLLAEVVLSYADLLYQQQAVEVAKLGIGRLDRQVAEAQSRYRLGQATRTDVAQLEAQRASMAAALAEAEGALADATARYTATIGEPQGALSADISPPSGLPATLAEARGAAATANPLLLRQQQLVEAARAGIDRERAERAPAIDLAGRYGRGTMLDNRPGAAFETASVGVALRLPLLSGGMVRSRVREAQAMHRAEQFEYEAVGRSTTQSADSAWAALLAARNGLSANQLGLQAAEVALAGVRSEYRYGLRSTLDILVADQSLTAAQLAVARSRRDLLLAETDLLRVSGRLDTGSYAGS
ncbi:type I secretion protein TolC [Sandaracinobacter neustonicus]|uniref:Type I secretion protein TolC n=1 Tax=Sandaracinobacter neustonicus TaxID=1715348 RepID=A0A501XWG9_9SPHN|nr:TolC family protein [Sandaracinobacter neustonicus]TPE64941.1 type I secretion protein TolC [Sandaracinobacter neustonicus]